MPYITAARKRELLKQANADSPKNAGELNFILTEVVLDYMREQGCCYATINDISGALTECLAEFRRRITGPYEAVKAHRNGDVYTGAIEQMMADLA